MADKQLTVAKYETLEVNFATADTDVVIPHTLKPQNPTDVRWEVMDRNAPGSLYRGSKPPGSDYIVLRSTEIGDFRIRLFIEANADPTAQLPLTSWTPPVDVNDQTIVTTDNTVNNVTSSKHGWCPKSPNAPTQFLNANAAVPGWDVVRDTDLDLTCGCTTNDVSTSAHGFVPTAPNDTTKFLRGDGQWAVPPDNDTDSFASFGLAMRTFDITDAEIKSMNTSPVTLVAAQANKILVPIQVILRKSFTATYSNSRSLTVRYRGDTTNLSSSIAYTNSTNDQFLLYNMNGGAGLPDGTSFLNTDVVLFMGTGDVTGGNAANKFKVRVLYQVFDYS